jgi:uncharacterized lipoprotein YmbA
MRMPVQRFARPDWRVDVDIVRFDVDEAGMALLDARWTLLAGRDERLAASRRERIEVPAGEKAEAKQRVAALREAVGVLAGRIGDAIATGR